MADLRVEKLGMINPFVIAASPATHGVNAILKSASARPGAVAMRNFRHPRGGGSLLLPSAKDAAAGKPAAQTHAPGGRLPGDWFSSLDEYEAGIAQARARMPAEVKLWVSLGAFWETVQFPDWEKDWTDQARVAERAGADAVELHFNTPGIAWARNRMFNLPGWITAATRLVKAAVRLPVMVKLPVEAVDPLQVMEAAVHAGADAIGPTARWCALHIDLDLKPGATFMGGYSGTQVLPIICQTIAHARLSGIQTPMFAGGGVYSWQDAAKLLMAGSECLQLGSIACSLGPRAVRRTIEGLNRWMDETGHSDMNSLCGKALESLRDPAKIAEKNECHERLAAARRQAQPDMAKCTACGKCADVCWFDALSVQDRKPVKTETCIGCGYCFDVCPTGALSVPGGGSLPVVGRGTKE
ncbi:MAG: hypothetical protein A3K19_28805 [Lentisphaerae bacterium RIFOXYB12_FULL_65_16]|nr:MAG: hypothetical protein A3K18_01515 [Lentisphaerae bacterium RIFOXYA12_64_32]OGV88279.1 MAG: hypothetical protein A3K19_28805 [Lentisphaerae bacterium RIFOXYB12_FULL_65_16]